MRLGSFFAAVKIGFIRSPDVYTNCVSRSLYASKSAIGRVATPESIAALATAGAIITMRRGSKGLGIRYSGPKRRFSMLYALRDDVRLLGHREIRDRAHARRASSPR